MNNSFEIKYTASGFTEKLNFYGKTIEKTYLITPYGYRGQDRAWEYENLPDDMIEALESGDQLLIVDALERTLDEEEES